MPIVCNNGTEEQTIDLLGAKTCVKIQPGQEICITALTAEGLAVLIGCPGFEWLEVKKDFQPEDAIETETTILCDVQPDGTSISFWAIPTFDLTGAFTGIRYGTLEDPSVDYTPTGTVTKCPEYDVKTWCVEDPEGNKYLACQKVQDGVPVAGSTFYQNPDGSIATIADPSTLVFCDNVEPCESYLSFETLTADGTAISGQAVQCVKIHYKIVDIANDGSGAPITITLNGTDLTSNGNLRVYPDCPEKIEVSCKTIESIDVAGIQGNNIVCVQFLG